ncbi:MAG TPA: response regulator transcription factor [Stellaceae bacterium]|jgi:DNA-binding NarL/FixJ family response regulator|nr:response regulator transcription factor [Stellaceae bacterium]
MPVHHDNADIGDSTISSSWRRARRRRLRILLADGDLVHMELLSMMLEPDHAVIGALAEGAYVVEMIARAKPDIAIIDIGMPGFRGIAATWRLQQIAPETKLVVLTTDARFECIRGVLSAGAMAYLVKPVSVAELHKAIAFVAQGGKYLPASIAGGKPDILMQ